MSLYPSISLSLSVHPFLPVSLCLSVCVCVSASVCLSRLHLLLSILSLSMSVCFCSSLNDNRESRSVVRSSCISTLPFPSSALHLVLCLVCSFLYIHLSLSPCLIVYLSLSVPHTRTCTIFPPLSCWLARLETRSTASDADQQEEDEDNAKLLDDDGSLEGAPATELNTVICAASC